MFLRRQTWLHNASALHRRVAEPCVRIAGPYAPRRRATIAASQPLQRLQLAVVDRAREGEPVATSRPAEAAGATRWANLRAMLERHGDPIVTCANLFQLGGFACSDALQLQSIMIFGNGGMALFFLTRMPTMGVAFSWALLKVCVNVYMVYHLTSERQPIRLAPDQLALYEEFFMPYGISARQFLKFWELGETTTLRPGAKIIVEGEPHDSMSLVLSGNVWRSSNGQRIQGLNSCRGDRQQQSQGDPGAWIAELLFLQMLDTFSGTEDVSRDLYRRQMNKALNDSSDVPSPTASRYSDGFAMNAEEDSHHEGHDERLLPPSVAKGLSQMTRSVYSFFGAEGETAASSEQIDVMLQQTAKWTVHTADEVVIRSWKLKPLLSKCQNDVIFAATLRKAFSQSAIRKVMAMSSAQVSFPFG